MAKRKSTQESNSESGEDSAQTRIRRPREYRFEMRVGDEAWESAGLVLNHRDSAYATRDYLNNMESTQEAGVTYRVTELIVLS